MTGDGVAVPSGLGTRGRRLWRDEASAGALSPTQRVLLEEACRAADRLDGLDRILRGDEASWMSFRALNEDGDIVKVVVTGVLSEVRQQQVALKQLLGELRQSRASTVKPGTPARPASGASPAPRAGGAGVSGVTDLAARIADKRRTQTAG